MSKYYYARVSRGDMNETRQVESFLKIGADTQRMWRNSTLQPEGDAGGSRSGEAQQWRSSAGWPMYMDSWTDPESGPSKHGLAA